jgi:hypothetical protein
MLSDRNTRMINDHIERSLRDLRMEDAGSPEAIAIINQIAEMQKLLTPQPTRSDILEELAKALHENPAPATPKDPTAADLIADILGSFRRRT